MKEIGIGVLIIAGIIGLIVLYFVLKPYVIKHDTTILFTGGLGSGKTLESVKRAIVLIRKMRLLKYTWPNFKIKVKNQFRKLHNKKREKKYLKLIKKGMPSAKAYKQVKPKKDYLPKIPKPYLYSNIPVHFKTHLFGRKREWAKKLQVKHVLCLKRINEYSVVLIDEMPQFISQFDWDIELVQKQANEFITFFRHYIGGHLIINAQSEDEIECHFRRKLNQGVWCFDFHAWPCRLFPLFYTNRMCDYIISENIQTMSTTYIEENTRIHFGLFPRKAYDSRCYSIRYKNVERHLEEKDKTKILPRWDNLKTMEVLRLRQYVSPLDTETTENQIKNMITQANKLESRNKDEVKGN